MHRWPRPLLPLLGGVAVTAGFAPFHLWPLALVALACWLAALRHSPTRAAAVRLTLWGGMAHGVSALYWLPWAFWHDSESLTFAILGGVPAMLGLALWVAAGYAILAALLWPLRQRPWAFAASAIGGVLVLETLRNLTPYGFPWLPLGGLWAGNGQGIPLLAQLASVGSVQLLSALVVAMAVLVSVPLRRTWLTAAALLMGVAGFGVWRTGNPLPPGNGPTLRLVQPNLVGQHKWDERLRWQFLQETLSVATIPTQAPVSPSLIVLPETAVPFFLAQQSMAGQVLANWVPSNTLLLTGTVRLEPPLTADQQPSYFNSLQVVAQGVPVASYDKHLLVPFGEFIPLRRALESLPLPATLRTLSQSRIDFTHGTASPLLPTPLGPALGLICYEGIFPLFVAHHAKGARWLVNVTNDAWFTGTTALYQHASLQRLRAIETGLPLVRSANTGISLITDAYGQDIATLPPATTAIYETPLPVALPSTLWRRAASFFSNSAI